MFCASRTGFALSSTVRAAEALFQMGRLNTTASSRPINPRRSSLPISILGVFPTISEAAYPVSCVKASFTNRTSGPLPITFSASATNMASPEFAIAASQTRCRSSILRRLSAASPRNSGIITRPPGSPRRAAIKTNPLNRNDSATPPINNIPASLSLACCSSGFGQSLIFQEDPKIFIVPWCSQSPA